MFQNRTLSKEEQRFVHSGFKAGILFTIGIDILVVTAIVIVREGKISKK